MISSKDSEAYFPHLHLHILRVQAERWVKKYEEAPIKRVLLYSFSFPFEGAVLDREKSFKPLPTKYAIVFDLDIDDNRIGMNAQARLKFDIQLMKGERLPECYERLEKATKPNKRLSDNEQYYDFMTRDFTNVYKWPAIDNYPEEWHFVCRFKNAELNANIKTDEPFVVLWKQNQPEDKLQTSITDITIKNPPFSISSPGTIHQTIDYLLDIETSLTPKDGKKTDEILLDDLLEKLTPDVEIFYAAMKRIVKNRKSIMHDLTPEIASHAYGNVAEQLKYIQADDINQGIDYGQVETPSRDIKGQLLRNLIFRLNPRLYNNRNLPVINYQALGERFRKTAKNLASK